MRRLFRVVLYSLAGLLLLVALAVAGLATPPGRALFASLVEGLASGNGLRVSIGTLSGWPPFQFGADRVVLADGKGPFAEISGLHADIDRRALLGLKVTVQELSAERINFLRAPELPAGSGAASGALLPFAVERLQISRLDLGPALLGNAASVSVAGGLISGGDGSINSALEVKRLDGKLGTLSARIARAGTDKPLSVDVTAEEAANGILTSALGRPEGPAYKLTAKTGYAGGTLTGRLTLATSGNAGFDGTFSLGPTRLTLAGKGNLADLVPPAYLDIAGGPLEINLDASWQEKGGTIALPINIDGRVAAAALGITARGVFGGPATDLGLRLTAHKPDGGALNLPLPGATPVALTALDLTGRVLPRGDGLRLDLGGKAEALRIGDIATPQVNLTLAIEAAGRDPLAADALPFALKAAASAITVNGTTIDATAEAPIAASATGSFRRQDDAADFTAAKLTFAGTSAGFRGTVAAGKVDGEMTLAAADLRALAPLAKLDLSGAISVSAAGTLAGPAGPKLDVKANARDLVLGDLLPPRFLTGEVKLAGTVAEPGAGTVTITGLTVSSAALSAKGELTLAPETLTGSFSGDIADLAIVAAQSSGAATFSAAVSGNRRTPTIDATIAVAKGTLLGETVENASVKMTGAPGAGGWSGAFSLAGQFAGRPLSGSASAALDALGSLAFPTVDLTIAENRVTGTLARSPDGLFTGDLAVDAPNLKPLAAFALLEAAGTVRANVKLTPSGGKQAISVAFNGANLVTEDVTLARAEGSFQIGDAFGKAQIKGTASGSGFVTGSVRFDTMQVNAAVVAGETHLDARVKGPDMDLTGTAVLTTDAQSGALVIRADKLAGTAYRLPVNLDTPGTLTIAGRDVRLAAHTALEGGGVSVEGAAAPQIDLVVVATGVGARVADRFSPGLGAEGTISGRATVKNNHNTQIVWQATWSGMRIAATRATGLPGLSLAASGTATGKATSLNAKLSGAGIALAITGTAPFRGGALNLTASGTAPLELAALASQSELQLGGTAAISLAIGGTADSPALSGTVDLNNATVADVASGVGIAGATGRIRLSGQTATVERLAGRLAQGGTVSVSGTVGTSAAAGLPANLAVIVDNGRYNDGDAIRASFSARLRISGPLAGNGTLSGTVNLGRTEIALADTPGGRASAVDVRHVNTPAGFTPPTAAAKKTPARGAPTGGGLTLDLTVNNNGGIFVRGFGLDAELGGSITMRGSTGDPHAVGAFRLVRGRLILLDRRFDIDRGTITFAGDLNPILDFAATYAASDVTVTALVTGTADAPEIHFTSSPALPEEEVLAHLLFGRDLGSLSPFQAAQLISSIATLAGASTGPSFVDRIRAATGLDDIDIRQNATGGTTVGVGSRIGDKLRLGVEQDTQAGKGKVTIDLDITKDVKVRGETGSTGSGKVGITYEHEY